MKTIQPVIKILILVFTLLIHVKNLNGQCKLEITTDTDEVSIFIDGKLIETVNRKDNYILEVKPGKHRVTASKSYFKTQIKDVFLRTGDNVTIRFEMERTKGLLNVNVTLDGVTIPATISTKSGRIGESPLTSTVLFTGPYTLRLSYDTVERAIPVNITENNPTTINLELGRELKISSTVNGIPVPADIRIDGLIVERSNRQVNDNRHLVSKLLIPGRHRVTALYNNLTVSKNVLVKQNEKNEINIELITTSRIDISASPSNSWVSINKASEIKLPLNSKEFKQGYYNFRITSPNCFPLETDYQIDGYSNYLIKAYPKSQFPTITANSIGRELKIPYQLMDLERPTHREGKLSKSPAPLILLIACGIAGAKLAGDEKGDKAGGALGGVLGGCGISLLIFPPKVKIRENINYNRNTVPGLLKEKNTAVEIYNTETKRLIEKRQMEIYQRDNIVIERITNEN